MELHNPYRSSAHIRWTTEIHAVKLLDTNRRSITTISYPEAALWDMIQQGFPISRINQMMSSVLKLDVKSVEKWTSDRINEWLSREFICMSDG